LKDHALTPVARGRFYLPQEGALDVRMVPWAIRPFPARPDPRQFELAGGLAAGKGCSGEGVPVGAL